MKSLKLLPLLSIISLLFCAKTAYSLANRQAGSDFRSYLFEENKGQLRDQYFNPRSDILFWGRTSHANFYISENGISYQFLKFEDEDVTDADVEKNSVQNESKSTLDIYRIDIRWLDSNAGCESETGPRSEDYINYYNALYNEDPVLNVHNYQWIILKNVYEGIDLKFYEENGNLKYDWIVHQPANLNLIKYSVKGAEVDRISESTILFNSPYGYITDGNLACLQNGKSLNSEWLINDSLISFKLSGYNLKDSIIIDPLIRLWGTYYGGNETDYGYSLARGTSGDLYLGGSTKSGSLIATVGAHQTSMLGYQFDDAFVVKFNQEGVRQWGTYYGGLEAETDNKITSDQSGNIYLSGTTISESMISTPGAFKTINNSGFKDAYLVKFDSNGVRQWGTYFGGFYSDACFSCAADLQGNIYITGYTWSTSNIATLGAHQTSSNGENEGFLAKFNTNGERLWSTFYGGSDNEIIYDCATDSIGNVVIAGATWSLNGISSAGANQLTSNGYNEGFLALFSPSGARLWGTYCGGNLGDLIFSCDINADSTIIVVGLTYSDTLISTPGAFQTEKSDSNDAFIVKYGFLGEKEYGSYYGGLGNDVGVGCRFDKMGNYYLIGHTTSEANIASSIGYQQSYYGNTDLFFVMFDSSDQRVFGSYYGNTGNDKGNDVIVDDAQNIYITGRTSSSSNISTLPSHQSLYSALDDAILIKFRLCEIAPDFVFTDTTVCNNNTFLLSTIYNPFYSYQWYLNDTTLIGNTSSIYPDSQGSYSVLVSDTNNCFEKSSSVEVYFYENINADITWNNDSIICEGDSVTLFATSNPGYNYLWFNDSVLLSSSYEDILDVYETGQYFVQITDSVGCIQISDTINLSFSPSPLAWIEPPSDPYFCGEAGLVLCSGSLNFYSLLWFFNDLPLNNETDTCLFAFQEGKYVLLALTEDNCSDSSNAIFLESIPTIELGAIVGESSNLQPMYPYAYQVVSQVDVLYEWQIFNGSIVSGQGTNEVICVWDSTQAGKISLTGINTACEDSAELEVSIYLILETCNLKQLSVYPNPATNFIRIENYQPNSVIEVYNILGEHMISFKSEGTETRLDLSDYAPGIYIIKIVNNFTTTSKLIEILK